MVAWYCVEQLDYRLSQTEIITNIDHATIIHGLKQFKKNIYPHDKQFRWKDRFIKKLYEHKLIKI